MSSTPACSIGDGFFSGVGGDGLWSGFIVPYPSEESSLVEALWPGALLVPPHAAYVVGLGAWARVAGTFSGVSRSARALASLVSSRFFVLGLRVLLMLSSGSGLVSYHYLSFCEPASGPCGDLLAIHLAAVGDVHLALGSPALGVCWVMSWSSSLPPCSRWFA